MRLLLQAPAGSPRVGASARQTSTRGRAQAEAVSKLGIKRQRNAIHDPGFSFAIKHVIGIICKI